MCRATYRRGGGGEGEIELPKILGGQVNTGKYRCTETCTIVSSAMWGGGGGGGGTIVSSAMWGGGGYYS